MLKRHKKDSIPMFLLVLVYAVISLYPLIWVILQSFKTEAQFLKSIWSLPTSLEFRNYIRAFARGHVGLCLKNTIINTLSTLMVEMVLITLAAFAFSKLKMKGKKGILSMVLLNMLIPTPIILLPMYLQVIRLNIQNTLLAIIFPYFQGFAPLGLVLLINYMNSVPNEMIEAAKMDGCSMVRILFDVMAPLVKPMLVTLGILGGMGVWNEYMWAMASISNTKKHPLSVGIAILRDQISSLGYTTVFAALSIGAMIFVIIYLCAQKTFVRSITEGAVKG